VLKRLEPRLETIQQAAKEYRRFPSIRLKLPVIVVAGFPNVGKSSFVTIISSAQPEVAEYPFTTKGISVGYFPLEPLGGQILDLPGLLDRPMVERNPIEQRAIAAIQYLADCIIFLVDPTWTCGYELTSQFSLFQEIQNTFPSVEVFPLLNKIDIASEEEVARATKLLGVESVPLISTLTGEGVEIAFQSIVNQSTSVQAKQETLQEQHHRP
jgi:nucleolar GTP-binding protein